MKLVPALIVLLALLTACSGPASRLRPAPSHTFRVAEDALARKEYDAAASAYRRYLSGKPDDSYIPRAYYQLALVQYRQRSYGDALASLDELEQRLPGKSWMQVSTLRGDIAFALGRRVTAVLAWERAWRLAGLQERPALQGRIEAAAVELTGDERVELNALVEVRKLRELIDLAELPPPSEIPAELPALEATAEETEWEMEAQPVSVVDDGRDEVVATSEPTETEPLAPPDQRLRVVESDVAEPDATVWELVEPDDADFATEASAGVREAEPSGGPVVLASPKLAASESAPLSEPVTKVGCLLPLTGPNRPSGQRALAGLRLAFADARDRLVVRDTGGDPKTSVQMFTTLEEDPEILGVIGPLSDSETEVVAPLAERGQLPLLLLSQANRQPGRFALQLTLTRSQQVEILVGYALDTLDFRRFGVLYPDDPHGADFANVFAEVVEGRGARLIGRAAYEPGRPDLGAISVAVKGWQNSELHAVFVPDTAGVAAAVAARVRQVMPNVGLLGTDSWNDETVLAQTGPLIEGAIFAGTFFVDSPRSSAREFVERFQRKEGRLPSASEAQAFDIGAAMRSTITDGATSRGQVISRLLATETFEGAGQLGSSPGGLQPVVMLLQYREGKVREIAPVAAAD